MRRSGLKAVLLALAILSGLTFPLAGDAQGPGGRLGTGRGSMGGKGAGPGMEQPDAPVAIPEKLPQPQNQEWLAKLREVLALEQLSRAQYAVDRAKFQAHRPYQKVMPQEEEHVKWLNALFKAYGLPAEVKTPPVRDAKTLKEAYEIAMKLEADLFAPYQWLIQKAEDPTSAQVLTTILYQSRRHYRMFGNALGKLGAD